MNFSQFQHLSTIPARDPTCSELCYKTCSAQHAIGLEWSYMFILSIIFYLLHYALQLAIDTVEAPTPAHKAVAVWLNGLCKFLHVFFMIGGFVWWLWL